MAHGCLSIVSIVIPIFNEEECLPELFKRLKESLQSTGYQYELIFVNDGSSDESVNIILQYARGDQRVKLINLSRNFGHQQALTAGLNYVQGDVAIMMDGDLQDPPEIIGELIDNWKSGNEIVIAIRRQRAEKGLKRILFDIFYYLLGLISDHPIPLNAGIFGLLDRRAVEHIKRFNETNRFIPGIRYWIGFKQGIVFYDRQERAAGIPKQSLWRLIKYGADAIFSFSYKPLRLASFMGIICFGFCVIYSFTIFIFRIIGFNVVRGFTTTVMAIFMIGGIQLLSIGILGEYLGRIYDEVKRRPYFIVSNTFNIEKQGTVNEGKI